MQLGLYYSFILSWNKSNFQLAKDNKCMSDNSFISSLLGVGWIVFGKERLHKYYSITIIGHCFQTINILCSIYVDLKIWVTTKFCNKQNHLRAFFTKSAHINTFLSLSLSFKVTSSTHINLSYTCINMKYWHFSIDYTTLHVHMWHFSEIMYGKHSPFLTFFQCCWA